MHANDLITTIDQFSNARILVIGDIMLDQYIYGDTSRISPEAPVPVVRKNNYEDKPGGAGNVALNIRKLGAKVSLLSMCGNDTEGDSLQHILTDNGINHELIRIDLPTIKKTRVLSKHQQLLRIDTESSYNDLDHSSLLDKARQLIKQHDAVILSDYAKGTLTPVLQDLILMAREQGKTVIVDPKEADLSRYKNANWITPNLNEFLSATSQIDNSDEARLEARAQQLIKQNNFDGILLTRSEKGMSLYSNSNPIHLPAKVREVFDVTGAGDTVIAFVSAGLAVSNNLSIIIELANIAAGIVVGKMGAAFVTPEEIKAEINTSSTDVSRRFGIVTQDQLNRELITARSAGEKIIFTNGCFDILHSGHVAYLEEARALGDRLIVAVNSDASVKQLKGDNRPIISLDQRMHLLSALSCVDWVVAFDEETPERLICQLLPDVLVKGGDYKVEEIAGHDCVKRNGGQTTILSFIDGISTSDIINRILSEN